LKATKELDRACNLFQLIRPCAKDRHSIGDSPNQVATIFKPSANQSRVAGLPSLRCKDILESINLFDCAARVLIAVLDFLTAPKLSIPIGEKVERANLKTGTPRAGNPRPHTCSDDQ
jgi:hypothetical protein